MTKKVSFAMLIRDWVAENYPSLKTGQFFELVCIYKITPEQFQGKLLGEWYLSMTPPSSRDNRVYIWWEGGINKRGLSLTDPGFFNNIKTVIETTRPMKSFIPWPEITDDAD
jgi:hypothetical protein